MRVRLKVVINFVLVAAAAAGSSTDASAQTRARRPQPQGQPRATTERPPLRREGEARESGPDANADVSITARVTADSLRFEKVPNPRVEFTGRPRRETAWESERENLPREVRPGETYRNVGITLHIRSVFADIDRIVAEALGEVPPSDEAQPAPPPAPNTPPPQPTTPPGQAPASEAATRHRRGPARRGRVN